MDDSWGMRVSHLLPPTTGKQYTFLGVFIFLSTKEYNCTIFLGVNPRNYPKPMNLRGRDYVAPLGTFVG
jgi:hypothetical protein